MYSETGMYKLCTCPTCRTRYIVKLHINCLKNGASEAEKEKIEHVLQNVTVKSISCDGELEDSIQGSLKSIIHDEKLYAEVMQRVHDVFETRI